MNDRAIILGCGGHSRTVINILVQGRHCSLVGLYDLSHPDSNEFISGIPVLGHVSKLFESSFDRQVDLYLAFGDNSIRQRWFETLSGEGYKFKTLISESANISMNVTFGVGSLICSQVYLGPNSIIGSNSIINTASVIEHEAKIGSASHIAPGCIISGRTVIGNKVFIGAGSTVIDNIKICDNVIIGAGSAVIHSITVPGTYVGVPAKIIKNKQLGFEDEFQRK